MSDIESLRLFAEKFADKIPFNQVIGLKVSHLDKQSCQVTFNNKPELVGNYLQGILHGGVISSAIDVAGGTMAAIALMQKKVHPDEQEELLAQLAKLGTIDLRIDYLRPGRGKEFTASARILRTGNKVAVIRMELHNEEDVLIALGTGTYLVG